MFGSIISGIVEGLVKPLTAIFTKKMDTDLEKYKVDGKVDVAAIDADARIIAAKVSLLKTALQYRGTRIAQYGIIYPWVLWWQCIILDCVGRKTIGAYFNLWSEPLVLALPPNLEYVSYAIIGYLFADTLLGKHRR